MAGYFVCSYECSAAASRLRVAVLLHFDRVQNFNETLGILLMLVAFTPLLIVAGLRSAAVTMFLNRSLRLGHDAACVLKHLGHRASNAVSQSGRQPHAASGSRLRPIETSAPGPWSAPTLALSPCCATGRPGDRLTNHPVTLAPATSAIRWAWPAHDACSIVPSTR